jgi:hypothetical protein
MKHALSLLASLPLAVVIPSAGNQISQSPAAGPADAIPGKELTGMCNARYGEVLIVRQNFLKLNVKVYSTSGLNECPDDLWNKLDAVKLKKQFGARFVRLNGPRYWVLDGVVASGSSTTGESANFEGLEMQLRGQMQIYIWQAPMGQKLYSPNLVKRDTIFSYRAGQLVYELISPQGDSYRMQSYSQIADPRLDITDLPELASRLKLPQGWRYQARILDTDSRLNSHGLACVINDELYNVYQKITS